MPTSHPTNGNSDRQDISEQDYERWLYESLDAGNYFQFRRDYLAFLSIEAAVVLQSLLNLAKHRNKDGWILATSAYMESQLYMTRWVTDRVLRELKKCNFIEVQLFGAPPLRHIRINLINLGRRLDEVKANRSQLHGNIQIDCGETYSNKGIPTEYPNKSNKHCRQADSPPAAARSSGDGSEDSMFPLNIPGQDNHRSRRAGVSAPKPKSKTPSPESRGYAARLYDKVTALGLSQHKNHHRPDKWAIHFDKLEKGVPASTIAHAFNWLMEHYGEPYVPKIESGKAFYDKFQKLLDAIERDKKANPQITISPEAKKIADKLNAYYIWPKGSQTQLPTVVEISLDTVTQLRYQLKVKYRAIREGDKSSPRLSTEERAAYCIFDQLGQAGFIREWFEQVHRRIATWDKWNGQLKPFDPSSKEFRVIAQSWTQAKCSDPKVCDRILKEITK